MEKLKEINQKILNQHEDKKNHRWFINDYFDLTLWEDETGEISGFQLSYDKINNEHVLTWKKQTGYFHDKVDDGELFPDKYKASPILISDGIFKSEKIARKFKEISNEIDKDVSSFVYEKLINYN